MFLPALLAATLALPARADPAITARVLVQNVYGRREKDCAARHKALADEIRAASPAFDVVALQEHWSVPYDRWFTCDADVLTKGLGLPNKLLQRPAASAFGEISGGVSVFSPHALAATYDEKFTNGRTVPLSGFALTSVELAQGVVLDVWTVHLEAAGDGCDQACRAAQAGALAKALETKRGKNPVLVVGDFNTGGPMTAAEKPPYAGNAGYDDLLKTLRGPRDLWLELSSTNGDPGFTYDCTMNATQSCKYRERIDFAFVPEDPKFLDAASDFTIVPVSVSVARYKTPAGDYVSDHFGLDVTLELRRRPKAVAAAAALDGRLKAIIGAWPDSSR